MKNIYNFGCRMNAFECQCVYDIFKKLKINNVIFVNTCAVTNESERQVRQKIRQLRKQNPKHYLVVAGCASQLKMKFFIENLNVDFVVCNEFKLKNWVYFLIKHWIKFNNFDKKSKEKLQKIFFGNFLKRDNFNRAKEFYDSIICDIKNEVVKVNLGFSLDEKQKLLNIIDSDTEDWNIINHFEDKSKVFVPIQTGCNHFCSFCIVPFTRGRFKSYDPELIIEQIKTFVKNGYNEVVLTGIDITGYGADFLDKKPEFNSLGKLCLAILKKTKLQRLRLSSIDVAEMIYKANGKKKIKEEIIEVLKNKRFMPYFHISLQSGSDNILKKMRRRHCYDDVKYFCDQVKKIRKDVAFGADIITGFPGETDEDFEFSKKIVRDIPITFVHAFPYSRKEGTIASETMNDNVCKNIKKSRVKELIEIGSKNLSMLQKKMHGTIQTMLVENRGIAIAENFMKINIDKNNYVPGTFIKKKVILKNDTLKVLDV